MYVLAMYSIRFSALTSPSVAELPTRNKHFEGRQQNIPHPSANPNPSLNINMMRVYASNWAVSIAV